MVGSRRRGLDESHGFGAGVSRVPVGVAVGSCWEIERSGSRGGDYHQLGGGNGPVVRLVKGAVQGEKKFHERR
jgi:hypothetical protein